MTESIKKFPAPKNITQARAFLGLVEQVSFSFTKCADMIAFRHLLSPKVKLVWTEELAKAFALAKVNICRKIHIGVRMFQVSKVTALVTDWDLKGQSLGLWPNIATAKGR